MGIIQQSLLLVQAEGQKGTELAELPDNRVIQTTYGNEFKRQFKRNRGVPILVFVATDGDWPGFQEALRIVRQHFRSGLPACICFCSESIHQQLRDSTEYDWITHLARLQDFEGDYPRRLIERSMDTVTSQQQQRQRRQAELDLYSYMTRISHLDTWDNTLLPEFMTLIAAVCGADISILLDKSLLPLAAQSQGEPLSWSDDAAQELALSIKPLLEKNEKTVLLNLEQSTPYHALISDNGLHPVSGSMILPLRCYQQVTAVLLIGFNADSLATLDLSVVSWIEKTAEHLRSQLERQLSQQRLKTQFQRLRNTIRSLHETREQLYHAEKLSSLGELAAGIAHEINNPVAFVMGNFGPLDEYIKAMVQLLDLHQQFMSALHTGSTQEREQLRQQLLSQQQEADLEYILDDVFSLVADSREGLERVCDIVNNLRSFARKDQAEMTSVDVLQVLTSTIKLVKYQLTEGVKVVNHVTAGLQVKGNAGMLGQVFLNLIQNAIHAMPGGGTLEITAETADNWLILTFIDSGVGMDSELVTRIFEPFFTTKEVGKGTGLGLSTVYGIVKKHQGDIHVFSEPGVGTRFELNLPLYQHD